MATLHITEQHLRKRKEEILWSVLCSFEIPKLHKCTFKQRSIAGSVQILHESSFHIISQLIRYSSAACGSYQDVIDRGFLLTRKLLNHWFLLVKVMSSRRKFYGHHHDLVDCYGVSVSQMTTDMLHIGIPGPFLIHDLSPGL